MSAWFEPHRGRLAVVYNDHMHVLGGGERSALAYARALSDFGLDAEIVSLNPVPGRDTIVRTYGEEFAGVSVRQISVQDIPVYVEAKPLVFVNHTFMSFAENIGQVGIYAQMFPAGPLRESQNQSEVARLKSYRAMACISAFARKYTVRRWDFDPARMHVLHPPVGDAVVRASLLFERHPPRKKKQLVSLGRFDPRIHNKNQHVIIETFLEACEESPELAEWTLVLVGNVASDQICQDYLARCKCLAERGGSRIEIRNGVSQAELASVLEESFGYVHAAGAFLPPGTEPERCEHLGLAIVEAMAHGCIPLVYCRGGILEILTPDRGGIVYRSREALKRGYSALAGLHGTERALSMRRQNLQDARKLDFVAFRQKLGDLLGSLSLHWSCPRSVDG